MGDAWEWDLPGGATIRARLELPARLESVWLGQRLGSRSAKGGKGNEHVVPLPAPEVETPRNGDATATPPRPSRRPSRSIQAPDGSLVAHFPADFDATVDDQGAFLSLHRPTKLEMLVLILRRRERRERREDARIPPERSVVVAALHAHRSRAQRPPSERYVRFTG